MIRLVLADDQELVREGLAMLLDAQPDLEVVGQAGDGEETTRAVAELEPDVVLMDIRMPGVDGLQATRQIVASGSPTRVLVLTTFDVDDYVYAALAAGASGFLLEDAPRASLLHGVRSVCAGDVLVAASATRRLVEQVGARRSSPPSPLLGTLTALARPALAYVSPCRCPGRSSLPVPSPTASIASGWLQELLSSTGVLRQPAAQGDRAQQEGQAVLSLTARRLAHRSASLHPSHGSSQPAQVTSSSTGQREPRC